METIDKNNYVHLIKEIDGILGSLRVLLEVATTPEEKAKIKTSIDATLDERIKFMKARDAVATEIAP
jgi:hypothetical protein